MAWGKNVPASIFSGPAPWQEPEPEPEEEPEPSAEEEISLDPSPEELEDVILACAKLWDLDRNRLTPGEDFQMNIGHGQYIWDKDDEADEPLFQELPNAVWHKKTFRAFMQLLDNYEASTEVEDRLDRSEMRESYHFMETIMKEPVMQYVHKYLVSAEKAPESEEEFIRNLFKLWFYSYSRGEARCASSGFEHVFVGEIDSKGDEEQAAGLHNWIQFYFLERSNMLDYRGYVLPKKRSAEHPDGDEQFLSVQFKWNGEVKPVSGMFVGTSPEFEFALYTLLHYCGEEENALELGGVPVNVRVYSLRMGCISSAFPEEAK